MTVGRVVAAGIVATGHRHKRHRATCFGSHRGVKRTLLDRAGGAGSVPRFDRHLIGGARQQAGERDLSGAIPLGINRQPVGAPALRSARRRERHPHVADRGLQCPGHVAEAAAGWQLQPPVEVAVFGFFSRRQFRLEERRSIPVGLGSGGQPRPDHRCIGRDLANFDAVPLKHFSRRRHAQNKRGLTGQRDSQPPVGEEMENKARDGSHDRLLAERYWDDGRNRDRPRDHEQEQHNTVV